MKTQTKTSSAPTFSIDVMLPPSPDDPLNASKIVKAGTTDHPWPTVADVPEHLRQYIGKPRTLPPPDTDNQRWTPPQILEMEREAIARLNSRDDMNPTLAAELEARDRDYLRDSADRNRVETEIEAREEADRKRLVAELERESAAKLKGYKS
jgi:hypothetical protein